MDALERQERERHFVEELGLHYQELGAPPMLGRVIGRLLVCDPAHQTSAQLAEYLGASRGAISTTTRHMLQAGLITKVPMPGERSAYFRIAEGAWIRMARARLAHSHMLIEFADRGLELFGDRGEEHTRRLQEFRDFYAFMLERMPALFDEWRAEQEKNR